MAYLANEAFLSLSLDDEQPSWTSMDKRDAVLKKAMRAAKSVEQQARLRMQDHVKKLRDEFEKQHPPKTEECFICGETMLVDDLNGFASFLCCGAYTCLNCAEKNKIDGWTNSKCPCCRESLPSTLTDQETLYHTRRQAEMGRPWQQHVLGIAYHFGRWGLEKNDTEAFKWWRRAADQGYRNSEYVLGICYKDGEHVTKCLATARRFFESAAFRGHAGAQMHLGIFYRDGLGGCESDLEESRRWLTLAASSQDQQFAGVAIHTLGILYKHFWAMHSPKEPALVFAKYWFMKALEDEEFFVRNDCFGLKGIIQHDLALTLLDLDDKTYGEVLGGPNSHPQAIRLFEKATRNGYSAESVMNETRCIVEEICNYCGACATEPLKRCAACKAAYYCSRNCQKRHYKFHKTVCTIDV